MSNVPGFNRVAWDLTTEPPVPWYGAPKWNRGPDNGADLLPGAYKVRLDVDGKSYAQPFFIAPDPRAAQTDADRRVHVAYVAQLYTTLSRVDVALNELDALEDGLAQRIAALAKPGASAALAAEATGVRDAAVLQAAELSSHPENGQDNDFLQDVLRERVQSLIAVASTLAPTAEQIRESGVVRRAVDAALVAHAAFMRDRVAPLQRAFGANGLAPIDLTVKRPAAKVDDASDEHGARREDD